MLLYFKKTIEQAKREQKQIKSDLKSVESKLVNIYHELELVKLNASQGYKVSKYLQELLKQRRKLKNELYNINILIDELKKNKILHTINNIQKVINEKKRVQKTLVFDSGVIAEIIQ